MAIKKVQLPDGSVQELHDFRIPGVDTAPVSGSGNVVTSGGVFNSLRVDKIAPIKTHSYENVLATTSNYNTLFPLFRVIPTNWDEPVVVGYRMSVYVDGHKDLYYSKHECAFSFFHETLLAYTCTNIIGNTSYRTIYYNSLMRCMPAYKTMGHLVGFNYYNNGNSYSRSCTTSGYGRTFEVEILLEDNCTVEWLDSCNTVSATVVPGYVAGTTHSGIANYNGTVQGETHSGDANTNTIGYYIRNCTIDLPMSAKMYRYRMVFTSADNTHWVPANTSTSTNATAVRDVNQTPINPFGQIGYYYTTTVVADEAKPGSGNIWRQYELTLGYSFNRTGAALVLTFPAPIYLKCAPQSDGSAIIDADNPYVQTLPSAADGKIYIYLGIAYSATNIVLTFDHPIYYHDGTRIRLWTDASVPPQITEETVSGWGFTKNAAPGTLVTTATTSQATSSGEDMSGTISLHKIAKTGNYTDLVGKPAVDPTPTQNSQNLVTSGGIYAALADILSQMINFDSVSSKQDGTVDIKLSNGDVITIDLNHEHQQYAKFLQCTQAEYDALTNKDSSTLYLIPVTT